MKTITKSIMLLLGAAATLLSCEKKETDKGGIIDIEQHYKMVYMLGGAPGKWDSTDPMPMNTTDDPDVFSYEIDLVRSAENKLIKFCVSVDSWEKAKFLLPETVLEGESYCYLKEGENKLRLTQAVLKDAATGEMTVDDHFFGLAKGTSGKYRLEVNPVKLTLKATKLSSIEEPEFREWEEGRVYMVGDATPAGWDINQPTIMDKNGDVHTFEGEMKAGEVKFPTKYSWNCPTYMAPDENGTEVTKAGYTGKVVLMEEGSPDQKFKFTDKGKYRITLNTKTLDFKVEAIK